MAAITLSDLQAALAVAFGPTNSRLDKIEGRLDKMDGRLDKIEGRLDKMDGRLDTIEGRLDTIEGRLDGLDKQVAEIAGGLTLLQAEGKNSAVRRSNSVKFLGANLTPLPYDHLGNPWPADVPQPARFLDLAVSGAEMLPGGGKVNWNRRKSRAFLSCALEGQDAEESDGEGLEGSTQSRTSRLRVIELMGGNFERITGAVYALH